MPDIKKHPTTSSSSFVFAKNRGIKNIATQIILVKLETYMCFILFNRSHNIDTFCRGCLILKNTQQLLPVVLSLQITEVLKILPLK